MLLTPPVFLAVGLLLSVSQHAAAYFGRSHPGRMTLQRSGHVVRCSSAARPCRLKAEMVENNPLKSSEQQMRRVITQEVCSCPPSIPCSSDWSSRNDKVVSRQLRTNGKINMTFSMMFCTSLVPTYQDICGPEDVALRLKGYSSIPTELHSYNCACTDNRPLVLHRRHLGPDFQQYDDFVCSTHKRRCNMEWNPDVCMIHIPENQTDVFPCKCPEHTECRESDSLPFRCLPIDYHGAL